MRYEAPVVDERRPIRAELGQSVGGSGGNPLPSPTWKKPLRG